MATSITVPRPEPAELEGLRAALLHDLDTQRAQLLDLRRTVEELTGQQDSDSALERELAERAIERAMEAGADIEHALRRIDEGTYGTCEQCGGPIGVARLEAIPHTRRCVSCTPGTPPLLG